MNNLMRVHPLSLNPYHCDAHTHTEQGPALCEINTELMNSEFLVPERPIGYNTTTDSSVITALCLNIQTSFIK